MVNKKALIIVGLGFGDEGKGLATDYLCLINRNSIVVRYNGGHQAGHCVVTKDGRKHVFSNFGAGSFRGIPTYWSRFCTFEPAYFLEELAQIDIVPTIYIDKNCPVTTHYDVLYNRAIETIKGEKRNGSCGVGFGATIDRQKIQVASLLFKEILDLKILEQKLKLIREYYRMKINAETPYEFDSFAHDEEDALFTDSVKEIGNLIKSDVVIPITEKEMFSKKATWETFIFEGAQGILLDQNFGIKPHITKSNTTSENAMKILATYPDINFDPEIYYITRAYQTRHGAGPFRKRDFDFRLYNNHNETNKTNEYQGEFRTNYLDIDMLNYSLKCDMTFSKSIPKNLIITCLDQFDSKAITVFKNEKKIKVEYREIPRELSCTFRNVKYSFSSCAEFMIGINVNGKYGSPDF